jgi:Mg-chelatase subunit ChlD
VFSPPKRLFWTPQVFAMTLATANSLGWPDISFGWRELNVLSTNQALWRTKKRGSDSPLKVVLPNPETTTSGRLALCSMLVTASGRLNRFERTDLERTESLDFLKGISGGIHAMGSSTHPGMESLCRLGATGPNIVIATEQEVYASYALEKLAEPIVGVRAKEGCFVFDHPIAAVTTQSVGKRERQETQKFIEFLLAPDQQESANNIGFRPSTVRAGEYAPLDPARGIDPSPISTIFEEPDFDTTNLAVKLWKDARPPADVLFVLDLSSSMRLSDEDRLSFVLRVAGRLIDSLGRRDTVGLLVFNEKRVLAIRPAPLEIARARFIETLGKATPAGGSALFDSVRDVVVENLAGRLPGRMPSIVVLSDGLDTSSRTSIGDLIDIITKEMATGRVPPIYTVGFGGDIEMDALSRISKITGGRVYDATENAADPIADDIAAFL